MRNRVSSQKLCLLGFAALALISAGCGSSGSPASGGTSAPPSEIPPDPEPEPEPEPPTEPPGEGCDVSFDGTFDAIQETIFERHGCTAQACHGDAASGGLGLSADVAYASLLEVASTGSAFPRITPGDNDRSYLWLKLAAKTNAGSVSVGGSPMPIGDTVLSADELELMRLWIKGGAPETGTVDEGQDLIAGCLPPAEPVIIRPLDPPPPGEGLQLVMPQYDLPAGTEQEICFSQYYDLTDQVPAEFQNPAGSHFRISASDLRQDPQSHHLILIDDSKAQASDFGDFFCTGGAQHGEPCEATDLAACGEGACASVPVRAAGCSGLGSFLLVVQQANEVQELRDGVFAEIPIKGFWRWNSHAFNLSNQPTVMHARLNYTFATEQRTRVRRIFDIGDIFAQATPPYGSETICRDHEFEQGTRVFNLISHTHKRGKRFWVTGPDGNQIYESFVYNDPNNQYYDPALAFDSPDAAERTIRFCAVYENGLAADGSPDPDTVKRRSTTPPNSFDRCQPVACTAGNVGGSCSGVGDDAACDSSPGAGDGECDACVLSGGVSTEDEMFILIGASYID